MIWLLACLPPAIPVALEMPDLQRNNPRFSQIELHKPNFAIWTGNVRGHPCSGAVLVEVRTQDTQLSFLELVTAQYVLHLPDMQDMILRFGCDLDRDGVVPLEAVGHLSIKTPTNARIDLWLPSTRTSPIVLLQPLEPGPDAPLQGTAPGQALGLAPGPVPGLAPGLAPGLSPAPSIAGPDTTPIPVPAPTPTPGSLPAPTPISAPDALSAPAPLSSPDALSAPAPTPPAQDH